MPDEYAQDAQIIALGKITKALIIDGAFNIVGHTWKVTEHVDWVEHWLGPAIANGFKSAPGTTAIRVGDHCPAVAAVCFHGKTSGEHGATSTRRLDHQDTQR
jgi:hypothetical protein